MGTTSLDREKGPLMKTDRQKILDAFGVSEDELAQLEEATGWNAAREAADRDREEFVAGMQRTAERILRSRRSETVHLPDEMGVHADDGRIWLAVAHYPKRHDARRWYMDFTGCHFLDVRVTVAWMRYRGDDPEGDRWVGCQPDDPGAFKCWQLESV